MVQHIPWTTGEGTLTLSYSGQAKGDISLSSSQNEGKDREMTIVIVTDDGRSSASVSVKQIGLREEFVLSDGEALSFNDEEFLVLKQ